MAVTSNLILRLQFADGATGGGCGTIGMGYNNFDSGQINKTIQTMTQRFSADVLVPDQTTDMIISLQGINNAQQIFFWSDGALSLKLIPYGGVIAATIPMTIMPNVPSVISVQNIVQITISNGSGQQARFVIQGAGV